MDAEKVINAIETEIENLQKIYDSYDPVDHGSMFYDIALPIAHQKIGLRMAIEIINRQK